MIWAKYYFEVLDKDFRGNAPTRNSTGCSVTKPCGMELIFEQKPCKGDTACCQTNC